jgi:5-methyltetrahydrofolate--homocysteine methyltransferase
MFDGLKTMDMIVSPEKNKFITEWQEKIQNWKETKIQKFQGEIPRSQIKPVISPVAPVLNQPIRLEPSDFDLNKIWEKLSKKSLFVLSWGLRGRGVENPEKEGEKLLQEWKKKVLDEKIFEPRAVYGYFVCHGGNTLHVDGPNGSVEFDFPRSSQSKHLCLTDYFGEKDLVAFQAVTVGKKVQEIIDQWNSEDRYTDAYYLHGLAVETAEAMAEIINQRIRDELRIDGRRGLRYSWGYPSCPDVSQHHLVWKLIDPSKSGMTLTEAGQIIPEQSTAAIVVHHPDAEYFVL